MTAIPPGYIEDLHEPHACAKCGHPAVDTLCTDCLIAASNGTGELRGHWERIDLSEDAYNQPTQPPAICGLVYTGKRHAISGPPEAAKTLVALIFGLEHHRNGGTFALIDFEMGAHATRLLLNDLGATLEEIRAIYYVSDAAEPQLADIQALEDAHVTLAIIDAAAGAYAASDLDDNKRKDAETFARLWVTPLWKLSITTILLDHVVKNTETRGKFSIGSERKLGTVDVHLGLEAVKQVHRGHTGIVKITTHKDRPGHLPRPTAATLELQSDPETHAITWAFKEMPTVDDEHPFRPTALMEKVSRWLEEYDDMASRSNIEQGVKGKAEFVRTAIDVLASEGHLEETEGARNARLYSLKRIYREALDDTETTSSHLVPTPSRTGTNDLVPSPVLRTGEPGTKSSHVVPVHPVPKEPDDEFPF